MKAQVLLSCALALLATVAGKEEKELPSLNPIVFDAEMWNTRLVDFVSDGADKAEGEIEVAERLKVEEISLEPKSGQGLGWLSAAKNGLRADPGSYQLLGLPVGEVIIRGDEGRPKGVTVSIYNRGDDGEISGSDFYAKLKEWKDLLDGELKVRAEERNVKKTVSLTGWMWRKEDTAYLLEGSENRSDDRPEFIRLRMASISARRQAPTRMARRGTFAENVKTNSKGFTYVSGIPMVDQGEKGYCVVASIERVARYFGAEVDQHEMAQLANTDEAGTSVAGMKQAFQKVTGKIHLRTLKHVDYDESQLEKDIRGYNRAAKSAKVRTFDVDPDYYYISPPRFWASTHKETFREMKRKQGGYDHFNRKIKEYVDQGIPLCWTLYLGLFKEEGLPQMFGGHMRLIIGYNEKTEMIMYSDSWGEGHEQKTMRADEAYCMTVGLHSMVPNR